MTTFRHVPVFVVALAAFSAIALAKPKFEGTISVKGKAKSEYSSLAKISLQEAISIATKQASGKIVEAALEDEDDFLVYEVEILTTQSGKKEFLIDAGSGKVLHVKERSPKSDDDEND